MDRFREMVDEDEERVDENLIPAGRVALRTLALLVPTMLAAGILFGLVVGLVPTSTDAERSSLGDSLVMGLVVGGLTLLFFALPVLVTVLAARGKMAHSKRNARVVMGVLIGSLWLFASLVVIVSLSWSGFVQYLVLAWPSIVFTLLVGLLVGPWLVAGRVQVEAVRPAATKPRVAKKAARAGGATKAGIERSTTGQPVDKRRRGRHLKDD